MQLKNYSRLKLLEKFENFLHLGSDNEGRSKTSSRIYHADRIRLISVHGHQFTFPGSASQDGSDVAIRPNAARAKVLPTLFVREA